MYRKSSKTLTFSKLRQAIECKQSLADVFELVSGYYSTGADVFTLHNCEEGANNLVYGISKATKTKVAIERSQICHLITASDLYPFGKQNATKQYENGVILCDFAKRAPYLEQYIRFCIKSPFFSHIVRDHKKLSEKQINCVRKEKIIVNMPPNGMCHSVLDVSKGSLPNLGCYGLVPHMNMDDMLMKAYWAILNSRVFTYYCKSGYLAEGESNARWKYNLISLFPVPKFNRFMKAYYVLANLADCLSFLSPKIRAEKYDEVDAFLYRCFADMLNMAIYELYFPHYVKTYNLEVLCYMESAPFMDKIPVENKVIASLKWYMQSNNPIRQRLMLLDTRSPELLYTIHTLSIYE